MFIGELPMYKLPVKVVVPVWPKLTFPAPEVDKVLDPKAILVEASRVKASASSVKLIESADTVKQVPQVGVAAPLDCRH